MSKKSFINKHPLGILIVIVALAVLFFRGGRFPGQIFLSQSSAAVGENVNINFWCGTALDVITSCDTTQSVTFIYTLLGGTSTAMSPKPLLFSGGGGYYASYTVAFNTPGSYDLQFCIGDTCESRISAFVVSAPTTTTAPSISPVTTTILTCVPKWTCKDSQSLAYKNADCSLSNIQQCQYGCQIDSCRPAPPVAPITVPTTVSPNVPTTTVQPVTTTIPQQNTAITNSQILMVVVVVAIGAVAILAVAKAKKKKRR